MKKPTQSNGRTEMTAVATEKCPHCGGPVDTLGRGRTGDIKRCRSCGREPGAPTQLPKPTPVAESVARKTNPARACPVEGCPGSLDAAGACACCARREAWREENTPKRKCRICQGVISGHGGREFCKACKPIAKQVAVAKAKAK